MPQEGDGQDHRTDSPPVHPENAPVETQPTQPVATGAVDDQTSPEHSTPSETPPESERPRDEAGRFAPKDAKPATPDPVKDAIDRLSKPDVSKPAGKQAAEKPQAPPTDEALKSSTKDDLDAPPEERARWKRDTAERFDRVLKTARSTREELEKAAPLIEHGKFYSEVLEKFELKDDIGFVPPEHFAGVVKAQAAVNRSLLAMHQGRQPAPGDVETVTALASSIDEIRSKLGLTPPKAPSQAAVTPFEGELPADLKDLVEVYGVDEKRVRMLAAMEAVKPPAAAPAPVAQPPAPVQPQQSPQPTGVDMGQLYSRKLLSELQTVHGVQDPAGQMQVLLGHQQTRNEVIRRFPGLTPADVPQVFNSLDPATRYEVLLAAHKALTVKQVPARPTSPPPPTTTRGVPTTAYPRGGASAAGQDAVAAAIAHLARE